MDTTSMKQTLQEIVDLAKVVYSNDPGLAKMHLKGGEMTLLPPASKSSIEALSSSCPFPLPPSYVQFLELEESNHVTLSAPWSVNAVRGTSVPA
jgi:hypothetical protein